jgi:hypothetical protein
MMYWGKTGAFWGGLWGLLSDELMLGRILASCNPTFVLVGITVVIYQFEYIGDRDSGTFDGAKAIP